MMTVFLSKQALGAYPASSNPLIQTLLQWQVGKRGIAEAIVDVGTGVVIRLPSQLVTVTALYSGQGPIFQVSGAVVDNSASSPPTQFTDPFFVPGGSLSVRTRVPNFAQTLRWCPNDGVYGLTAIFFGDPTAALPVYQQAFANSDPIPIPGGSEFVEFQDAGGGSNGQLVYGLTL